ncbi:MULTISPECIES: acyl-CoA dehydrogenase family protein [unclassified Pseudonocardia]|uniref:acyl-CoA dehydrogenase family protein n=1 Tax=unclassified Pseudonocardia TaxID=2619320 RepID=UPI000961EA27|nr:MULTISPECIES: acyl-CoA dehydrogenase family protein [unclassified Pseudonocardia]MBN9097572.1 acyl-CoA/acyl-ACP dehydrogenase [Pseudonocardia sp.]OJY39891.1 MAG: acyl-CoA dehydrogenase [Pseudonocardia sp. 73-21]
MADGQVRDALLTETDERRALRDAVGKLVGGYGREYFQDVTRKGEKPDALWADMGKNGFLGVHLPEEYGGGGGGLEDLALVIEETAAQGCPMFMLVISPAIAGSLLVAHGTPAQKQKWLPGIADGTKKVCFAITEPDAGTNTHNITTTAHRDESGEHADRGWRLRGQKYWTSGIDEADAVLVVAKDVASGKPSLFLIPTDAPGLSWQKIDSALQIPENQFTTFYDDVPVPADGIVGAEGAGLKAMFAGLNPERVTAAAQANGIGRYAIKRGARYASERTVWSTPIGAHQGIAHPLAKAYIEVQLSRLMTQHAAQLADAGAEAGEAANIAKYSAGEAAVAALDHAIQIHGGNGLSNEYGLSDLWFTARMFRTAPVSKEMVLNHVAQHSLGLPKSY